MKFLTKESFIEYEKLYDLPSDNEFGEIERITVEWLECSARLVEAYKKQVEKSLERELDFDDFIELDVSGVSFIDGVLTLFFDLGEMIFKGVEANSDIGCLTKRRFSGVEVFCEGEGVYQVNMLFEAEAPAVNGLGGTGGYLELAFKCKDILTKISG